MRENPDPRQLLVDVAKVLERLKIPYVVTGGIAVLIWGRPRFTADIDIVIQLKSKDVQTLSRALHALGKAGYLDEEIVKEALAEHGEFNFIDGESGVKVDFWVLKNEPFEKLCLARRVAKKILGKKVYFLSAEDLILSKLKWYKISPSSRQLEDVESILKISGKNLDKKYLKNWAQKLSVDKTLEKLE